MNSQEIAAALAEPFPASEVKWLPVCTTKDKKKAMVCAYIESPSVMQRLDDVLGVGGWTARYDCLDDGCVVCTLSAWLNGMWIDRADVGAPSQQPEAGNKRKAAFTDSLKRAAVHFGIGRYLHHLPRPWVGYDEQKKQLTENPKLPPWALPRSKGNPTPAKFEQPPAAPVTNGNGHTAQANGITGAEFKKKLDDMAKQWAEADLCTETYFWAKLNEWSHAKGYNTPTADWPLDWIKAAGDFLREFNKTLKLLQPINKLIAELGWSPEQKYDWLEKNHRLKKRELPSEQQCQAILLALQEEVRKKMAAQPQEDYAEAF